MLLSSLLAGTLLTIRPAPAITGGELDSAGRYPNVGLVALKFKESRDLQAWCSGTLIAPRVFLTAGHCDPRSLIFPGGLTLDKVFVTFDLTFIPDPRKLTTLVEVEAIDSRFSILEPPVLGDDIAVLVLRNDATRLGDGIQPASLPTAGLLDELAASGGLAQETFITVGYGLQLDFMGGQIGVIADFERRFAASKFIALATPGYVTFQQNVAAGNGGNCFGDSGGPYFIGDSDVIGAITSFGDPRCVAIGVSYRLDTENARAFLAQYVPLP